MATNLKPLYPPSHLLVPFRLVAVWKFIQSTKPENCTSGDPWVFCWLIDPESEGDRCSYWEQWLRIFLPLARACARGKVIDSVVVSTKIARSLKISIGQSALCHQRSKKNYLQFTWGVPWALQIVRFHQPCLIDHTCLPMLCACLIKIGKGHRVITSISMHIRPCTALQLTQGTRLSISHCYYNGNVVMVRGVCALGSSSFLKALTPSCHLCGLWNDW